jgi:DNA-binding response OmpR family regulator
MWTYSGISGHELLIAFRKLNHTPVLMMTALSDDYNQIKAFDAEADDYVTKPFKIQLLLKRVEALLRRSGALAREVSNVILNAVQNTPIGGEIRIWSEPAADQYRLCVLNMGVRIDDTVLPKLFDPFYRVDKARSRRNERSGLRLAIVRKTLEAMMVDYALENTPDGVLFWMNLPKTT